MKKNLVNEYDLLESVIVHSPNIEHNMMTPKNLNPENKDAYLLFDDIIYVNKAREEHFSFTECISQVAHCLELTELLEEVLSNKELKKDFIKDMSKAYGTNYLVPDNCSISNLLSGVFTDKKTNPLPNIMFTRDLGISIQNSMIITWASNKVRNPENIIAKYIIKNHTLFSSCDIYDFHENHPELALEGGDVTLINENVIAIGIGERTSKASVEAITPFLYKNGIKHIMCFNMPEERRFMHLDTVFSITDRDEAIIYPPFFEKDNSQELDVDIITASQNGFLSTKKVKASKAFKEVKINFNFIKCGGELNIDQQREQWTDGANAFCISPGKITIYDRNINTIEQLQKHGYKIINWKDTLDNSLFSIKDNQKIAVTIESGELSRGRGGPRCMTMPINRIK